MFIKSCLINGADVKSHVIAFNATNIFVYKVLAISLLQFCIYTFQAYILNQIKSVKIKIH